MGPTGILDIRLTNLAGSAVPGIRVDLDPVTGEPGSGGEPRSVKVAGPIQDLIITAIPCREGPGTMYKVTASAPHYRRYAFFQLIKARTNTASDDVEFWVRPGDVKDIAAPSFKDLPPEARGILSNATTIALEKADKDLVGLTGQALYDAFGPLRKACFLNLMTKGADDTTAGGCIAFVTELLIVRQDRFFAGVDSTLPQRLRKSPVFKSASNALHEPLPGYVMAEGSFKSRDAHANIQVTFMRDTSTGRLAADIDIDESSGIEHGMEVIRNAVFNKRTNPYLIHEFLLAADPIRRSLDPGYEFVF